MTCAYAVCVYLQEEGTKSKLFISMFKWRVCGETGASALITPDMIASMAPGPSGKVPCMLIALAARLIIEACEASRGHDTLNEAMVAAIASVGGRTH